MAFSDCDIIEEIHVECAEADRGVYPTTKIRVPLFCDLGPFLSPTHQQTCKRIDQIRSSGSKTPLNSLNQEIRLLHILPGCDDEPLKLELSSASLAARPTYATLSYCWGPQDDQQDVEIEGTPFQISRHLQGCLLSLRQPDEPLSIWVDAICINQQSNQEKNTQVPLMKDIYKSAAQMFVWMGQTTQGLDIIFNSIQDFAGREVPIKIQSIQQVAKEVLNTSPGEAERAFHEFVNLSWFRRTWIIQELALPRSDPIFVCGHRRAPWTNLKRWWLICQELNGTVMNHSTIMGTEWEKLHSTLNFPALRKLYQLRELFEAEAVFQRGLPLSVLVVYSEESVATDPRDKIYGILGISNANAKSKIAVDYDKSVGDLYEEASRYLIMEESQLRVLGLLASQSVAASRASSDPSVHEFHTLRFHSGPNVNSSWIRDFGLTRGPTLGQEQLVKVLDLRGLVYDASTGSPPMLHSKQQKRILSIVGLKVDVVKDCDIAWRENPYTTIQNANLKSILEVFFRAGVSATGERDWGGYVCTKQKPESKEEDQRSPDYPWHLLYQPKTGPTKPIREAIWRTLVGDKTFDNLMDAPKTYDLRSAPESYEALFLVRLDFEDGKTTSDVSLEDFDSEEQFQTDWKKFQDRLRDMVRRRAAFSTEDGWIGLGPDSMRTGDFVVVLSGSDVPSVLRPVEDGYILVGECYVEGIMYGEFVKASTDIRPDGSKVVRNAQVFHIR